MMKMADRMNILDTPLYLEDVMYVAGRDLPWDRLQNRSVLITGRSEEAARERFFRYLYSLWFRFMSYDINPLRV